MLSGDEVSCSRGWPHAFSVTEDDLDFWILCLLLGLHISAIIPSNSSLILPLKLYSEQDWGSLPCLCLLGVDGVTQWSLLESSLGVGRSGSLETPRTGEFLCLPCIPFCCSCFYCFCSFAFINNYEVAIRLTVDFCRLLPFLRNRCVSLCYPFVLAW